MPGYFVSTAIMPGKNLPLTILAAAIFGTALMYITLTIFAGFHLDIYFIGYVMPIISVALALLYRLRNAHGRTAREGYITGLPAIPAPVAVLLAVLLVFACLLIIWAADSIYYTSDSPDHIAYIRTISRSHEVFPTDFLYKGGDTLTRDIRKGLGHAMWGTINMLTSRPDVHHVWPLISITGSVLIIISIFCAGFLLFRNATIGLIAAVLFVFFYHRGLTGRQLITIAYSFPFGKIYLVAFLTAAIIYYSRPQKEILILAAAASVAAIGTHANHFLLILFLLFVFSMVIFFQPLVPNCKTSRRRMSLGLIATVICVNLPYLLLRYIRDYSPNNEIHTHIQGTLRFSDSLFIVNPLAFLAADAPLFILTFISLFILWRKSRDEKNLRFLLWGVIALYLTIFNPILVPLITRKISYLLTRLEFAIPTVLITGYLLHALWNKLRGREPEISRHGAVMGWICAIVLLGFTLLVTPSRFAYSSKESSVRLSGGCLCLADLFEYMNSSIPKGTTILSDPVTSYCIPAFTDQFVVCTFDQHSIPNDSTAVDRILECRDIFLPDETFDRTVSTLKKYGADHIVINGRIPASIVPMFWSPDTKDAERIIEKFSGSTELFTLKYYRDRVALFEFSGSEHPGSIGDDQRIDLPLGPSLSIDEALTLHESGEPNIYIRDLQLDRMIASKGDSLRITIEWVAKREIEPRGYISHLRFDTHFEKGPLYHDSFGKPYRKILERIQGLRFRFTVEHLPLNSTYPPDKWPVLRVVRDVLSVRIPDDIATGVYSISVRMSEKSQYPNYTLRDIFTNEDGTSGVVMGEILIE